MMWNKEKSLESIICLIYGLKTSANIPAWYELVNSASTFIKADVALICSVSSGWKTSNN
jgi:hypothetical protein